MCFQLRKKKLTWNSLILHISLFEDEMLSPQPHHPSRQKNCQLKEKWQRQYLWYYWISFIIMIECIIIIIAIIIIIIIMIVVMIIRVSCIASVLWWCHNLARAWRALLFEFSFHSLLSYETAGQEKNISNSFSLSIKFCIIHF